MKMHRSKDTHFIRIDLMLLYRPIGSRSRPNKYNNIN